MAMTTFKSKRQTVNRMLPQLLGLYVILQPILDVLTSVATKNEIPLTIGTIARTLFILCAAIYIFGGGNYPWRRPIRIYFGAVTGYLAAFGLWYLIRAGFSVSLSNLGEAAKMFYFLYAVGFLLVLYRRRKFILSDQAVAVNGAGYSLIILLAYVTGTSFVSYNAGYGYCGWFYAANDVSMAILLTAPVLVCSVLHGVLHPPKRRALFFFAAALALFSLIFSACFLGTKLIYLGVLLYLFAAAVWFAVRWLQKRERKILRGLGVTVILAALLLAIYPVSPLNAYINDVYVPMSGEDQDAYEESLKIPGIEDKDREKANQKIEKNAEGTWIGELVDTYPAVEKINWVLSRRLLIIAPVAQQYIESGAAEHLLGIGYVQTTYYTRPMTRLVEMEGAALLLRHGVLGAALYYLPFLGVMLWLIAQFFKEIKCRMTDFRYCSLLYSVMIALAASLFTGHTLETPCTSILVAILMQKLVCLTRRQNQKLAARRKRKDVP